MNKNESKYFNTAKKMNSALLEILSVKDFEYISVKEICAKAGVNRSTFYLHYDNLNNLLEETIQNGIDELVSLFDERPENFIPDIENAPLRDLYFITPKYIFPYLDYIKQSKKLLLLAQKHSNLFHSESAFNDLSKYIIKPIMLRFSANEAQLDYLVSFYVQGINGIMFKWLQDDCDKSYDEICDILNNCIPNPTNES